MPTVATSKWKSEPPMGDTYLRHMSRLQTAVDEEERRLLAYLQRRCRDRVTSALNLDARAASILPVTGEHTADVREARRLVRAILRRRKRPRRLSKPGPPQCIGLTRVLLEPHPLRRAVALTGPRSGSSVPACFNRTCQEQVCARFLVACCRYAISLNGQTGAPLAWGGRSSRAAAARTGRAEG